MLKLRDDPNYQDTKTCHLYTALEAAMQIQIQKVIVGPNDSVGILLFNTVRYIHSYRFSVMSYVALQTRQSERKSQVSEIKKNTFAYQPIGQISAPKIRELMQLLDGLYPLSLTPNGTRF
jgi:ATP-dependent DNA helicase 2 subunit 1